VGIENSFSDKARALQDVVNLPTDSTQDSDLQARIYVTLEITSLWGNLGIPRDRADNPLWCRRLFVVDRQGSDC
jgi:hypothetical protein